MADALIETVASNPYESIVADTSSQINNISAQIQEISQAIANLEKNYPTSTTLPQLRERLANLQDQLSNLNTTNNSAKSLLNAYNDSLENANTMEWVYQLKQAELNRAQQEADQSYRRMYADVKRSWENYINALQNATASENAIINANAGREWASAQSTAEARARNYLSMAQAWSEAANNTIANLNAIEEWRLNSNAWYVQLSQSNADNTLRQQVLNDYDAQQAALNRAATYWNSGSGWSSLSNIKLPDTTKNEKQQDTTDIIDPSEIWIVTSSAVNPDWSVTVTRHYNNSSDRINEEKEKTINEYNSWKYWITTWDVWLYHNNINWKVTYDNWNYWRASDIYHAFDEWWNVMVDLDRNKTNDFLTKNNKYWDLWSTSVEPTTNWYLKFTDRNWNIKFAKASDLTEDYQWKTTQNPLNWRTLIR